VRPLRAELSLPITRETARSGPSLSSLPMSSLVFYTDADNIVVATDTLAVRPDGSPFMFCSKATYVPHLRTIVAGTGAGGFAGDWAMQVNNRMVVNGIEHLNFHTPQALAVRWGDYRKTHNAPDDFTTTVYHFGFSEDDGKIAVFAYRSTNNFTSERLPTGGFGVKPPSEVPEGGALTDVFEKIIRAQREEQDALPAAERIYIGGEVQFAHLTAQEHKVWTLFNFDDFEQQRAQIFANFAKDRASS